MDVTYIWGHRSRASAEHHGEDPVAAGYKVVSGLLVYKTIICVLHSIAYIFYIHLLLIRQYMHSIVNYLVFGLGSFMIGLCECMCMYMLGMRTGTKQLLVIYINILGEPQHILSMVGLLLYLFGCRCSELSY